MKNAVIAILTKVDALRSVIGEDRDGEDDRMQSQDPIQNCEPIGGGTIAIQSIVCRCSHWIFVELSDAE